MKPFYPTLFIILALCGQARAQSTDITECGNVDTSVIGTTTPFSVLGRCNIITGPSGHVLVMGDFGYTGCGASGETFQFFIAPGTSPVNGSVFVGSATGTTLAVTQINEVGGPAFGWTIEPGQTLMGQGLSTVTPIVSQLTQYSATNSSLVWDAGTVTVTTTASTLFVGLDKVIIGGATPAGFNGTTTALITIVDSTHFTYPLASNPCGSGACTASVPGTSTELPGGKGTYSLAASVSSLSGIFYTLNPLPGGMTAMSKVHSQSVCFHGLATTNVVGYAILQPKTAYWIGVSLAPNTSNGYGSLNNAGWQVVLF